MKELREYLGKTLGAYAPLRLVANPRGGDVELAAGRSSCLG